MPTPAIITTLTTPHGLPSRAALAADGATIAIPVYPVGLTYWSLTPNSWLPAPVSLPVPQGDPYIVNAVADGAAFFLGGTAGRSPNVAVAYTHNAPITTLSGLPGEIGFGSTVALARDGSSSLIGLLVGGRAAAAHYDASWTRGALLVPPGSGTVAGPVLSADGRTVAAVSAPGTITSWAAADGWRPKTVDTAPSTAGTGIALSGDGRTLAVQRRDRPNAAVVRVYRRGASATQPWGRIAEFAPVEQPAPDFGSSLALSGDGSVLVAGFPSYRDLARAPRTVVGAFYRYEERGGSWHWGGLGHLPGDPSRMATSVGLSADGATTIADITPFAGGSGYLGVWGLNPG